MQQLNILIILLQLNHNLLYFLLFIIMYVTFIQLI